jgi:hypothetical protein
MPLTYFQPSQVDSSFNGYLRNRIINGAMMIDQRNVGAAVTPATNTYVLDRWVFDLSQSSKFSVQQSSVVPPGFVNSCVLTSLSAYSIGAGDFFIMRQSVEGLNVYDLAWGSASASTVTLSFWVRSSLTGTFGGSIRNSADNRSYVFSYTINGANAWEYKTISIPGDTSGTWLTTNGVGLKISFSIGTGSTYSTTAGSWVAGNYVAPTGATSVVGTNGATFYITGVQLEDGAVATPFERRQYGTELQLAQRYYWKVTGGSPFGGIIAGGASFNIPVTFPQQMRAVPTVTLSSVSDWTVHNAVSNISFSSFDLTTSMSTNSSVQFNLYGLSTGSAGQYGHIRSYNGSVFNATAWLAFSSEL